MSNEAQQAWDEILVGASQSDGVVDFCLLKDEKGDPLPAGTAVIDVTLFQSLYANRLSPGSSSIPTRWLIKGGRFSGMLDLSDGRQGGSSSLPALEFEDCIFPEGFCADNSHIRRLTFAGCEFGAYAGNYGFLISIGLRNTLLEGDLNMQRLKSFREDGLLTIAAPAIDVMGTIRLSDTVLTGPADTRRPGRGEDRAQYALNLSDAKIRDRLTLAPRVVVRGGLDIRSAHIGGELELGDMNVNDGLTPERRSDKENKLAPRAAIEGTGVFVGGNIFFRGYSGCERFTAEGAVLMYGFETKSSLVLTGASFDAAGASPALGMASGKVGVDLIAVEELRNGHKSMLRIAGTAEITGVTVGGQLKLYGTVANLMADCIRVQGDVTLAIRASGIVDLQGADLKGLVDLSSFSFEKGRRRALSLRDADIGHTLRLAVSPTNFLSCRRASLLCYPTYEIFEIWFQEGTAAILFKRGKEPVLLEGSSVEIHRLSGTGAINLSTPEAICDYLRFFGAYVWGGDRPGWEDEGAFAIAEGLSGLPAGSYDEELAKIIPEKQEIEIETELTEEDWKGLKEQIFKDPTKQPDDETWAIYQTALGSHGALARSFVRYTAHMFIATFFVIKKSVTLPDKTTFNAGTIWMIGDYRLGSLKPEMLPEYTRPLVLHKEPGVSDYKCDRWKDVTRTELSLRIPRWNEMLEKRLARFQDATVDLTNASCRTLDDAHGRAWGPGKSSLYLENFVYLNVNHSTQAAHTYRQTRWLGKIMLRLYRDKEDLPQSLMKDSYSALWLRTTTAAQATKERLAWLARIPKEKFTQQPYTQLANVLSATGDDEAAKVIEEERIRLGVKRRPRPAMSPLFRIIFYIVLAVLVCVSGPRTLWLTPLILIVFLNSYRWSWAAFRLSFRYGLSPGRATRTMLLCLAVGWWGVDELNSRGYLVQNTSTVATLVEKNAGGDLQAVFPYAEKQGESSDLRCGPAVNGLLYATDVFIPLLDLRQESKCDIRSLHKGDVDPEKEWADRTSWRTGLVRYLRAVFRSSVLWAQFAKSFYAILGWIVTSLTILTYSGILRRWGEK